MTKIKLCGLSRPCDIDAANELKPDYIGFVFAQKSIRYVDVKRAAELKKMLIPEIQAVGVFVNENPGTVAELLRQEIIDAAQLHGSEDETYIRQLQRLTDKPVIKAFKIASVQDVIRAEESPANMVLLDSGAGGGELFDWRLLQDIKRPYFLAGGLAPGNAAEAVCILKPYGVDVSSGIETGGYKDKIKMAEFIAAVRKEEIK